MNVVLLVNSYNLPDIRAFVEAAASLQKTKTPGAIAVVYQQKLGVPLIEDLTAPLLPLFSAASSLPVPIAASLNDDGRNATLFALFIAQVYARYPGPWLVIDGPGVPKVEDFVTEAFKQHKILNGRVTGRASMQGDGITPVGPVILDLPAKDLKWFSPGATESWRARARFLLGRCGFRQVPLDEYLFSIPKTVSVPSEATIEAPSTPTKPFVAVEDEEAALRDLLAEKSKLPIDVGAGMDTSIDIVSDKESGKEASQTVASTQAMPLSTQPPAEAESCAYDNLSDEDLRTQIEIRDLPKPHHFTGRSKLLQILCDDDDAKKSQP